MQMAWCYWQKEKKFRKFGWSANGRKHEEVVQWKSLSKVMKISGREELLYMFVGNQENREFWPIQILIQFSGKGCPMQKWN